MKSKWGPLDQPAVIDLSHNNADLDSGEFYVALREAGVQLVILKATQGVRWVDPTYAPRRKLVTDAGLLVEAYHFLDGSDPDDQVAHFIAVAELDDKMRGALDCEVNPNGQTVQPQDATLAALALDALQGRQTLRYTGAGYLTPRRVPLMVGFLNGPLWLAKYGPQPTDEFVRRLGMDPANLTFWQYSDKGSLAGKSPIDLSAFSGTPEELALWPALGHEQPAPAALPLLRRGDKGPSVIAWQQTLRSLGNHVLVDGDFGPATEMFTRSLQQSRRLNVDGIVGSRTRAAAVDTLAGR
jgi:lysozyme